MPKNKKDLNLKKADKKVYEEQKQWLSDWLTHPESKKRAAVTFNKYINDNPVFKNFSEEDKKILLKDKVEDYNRILDYRLPKFDAYTTRDLPFNVLGQYNKKNPGENSIILNSIPDVYIKDGKLQEIPVYEDNKSTTVHEFTHATQQDKIQDKVHVFDKFNKDPKKANSRFQSYILNGREVYPRIMEIRYNNKLTPDETITNDKFKLFQNTNEIKELEKAGFSEEEIIYMLNNMADASSNDTQNMQSKYGGPLKTNNMNRYRYQTYNNLPIYADGGGFGDFLQSNAGTIGTVLGAGIGSIVPGAGTAIGASIGGGLGNMVQGSYEQDEAADMQASQQAAQNRRTAFSNYQNNMQPTPNYGANFAKGGRMYPNGGDLPSKEFQQYRDPYAKMQSISPKLQSPVQSYRLEQPYIPQAQGINYSLPQQEVSQAPAHIPLSKLDHYSALQKQYNNPGQQEALKRSRFTAQQLQNQVYPNQDLETVWQNYITSPQGTQSIQEGSTIGRNPYGGGMSSGLGNVPIQEEVDAMKNTGKRKPAKLFAKGGPLKEARYNKNITYYANGGSHKSNPNGGIPIGNKGLVEQDEFRYKDYIFSNRF